MNSYAKVFESLYFPATVSQCAAGTIKPPLATFKAPAEWYGFPPALIPIWSDGSRPTYIGAWKHWFTDRKPTYIKMHVGAGRMTIEIARTVEQLFALAAMMSISEQDGVESDLVNFAKTVGLQNLDQINAVSLMSGDDARGLAVIDQFKNQTPLESAKSVGAYSGEFPLVSFDKLKPWWNSACSFEISQEILAVWPTNLLKPAWIDDSGKDKIELFNEYLSGGNLKYAWLTLNSTGWTIRDARTAISALNIKAKDSQFNLLVDAWLSIADESAGGY